MARPRKYSSEAEAKAAKLDQQRQKRAAVHALKNDPTKRKDAAVNAEVYPFAPVNDTTMAAIQSVKDAAGSLEGNGSPEDLRKGRLAVATMVEWEEANKMRLPSLRAKIYRYQTEDGVSFSYPYGEEHEWNRLSSFLRVLAHFMERSAANKLKADRHAERERAEAEVAGVSVSKLRDRKDSMANRKWQAETQAAYQRAKSEKALATRNARIERDSTERMEKRETFGRF